MKKKKRHPDHDDMTWGKQDMTAFLKHVPLMALCLIGCTYVSSFAETVDGNDTGGVLHLEGGTYEEIIGRELAFLSEAGFGRIREPTCF